MPLSWNEIRQNAIAFSREWIDETRERAEAQTFWNDFFHVFGVRSLVELYRRVLGDEHPETLDFFPPMRSVSRA